MSADEHTRAVERDTALLERLGKVLEILDRLIDRVAELERDLSSERVARERLELRVNAEWLRDRGYTLGAAGDEPEHSGRVLPLVRPDASPDAEPTTTAPAADAPHVRTCSRCGERPTTDPRHDLCGECDDILAGGHRVD